MAIEVIVAEILIHRSILEHVIDGREHGCGHGHDRLLCSAAHLDAMVLGAEVAVVLLDRRLSALHKGGLEPAGDLANAIGAALAGALVIARADAGL